MSHWTDISEIDVDPEIQTVRGKRDDVFLFTRYMIYLSKFCLVLYYKCSDTFNDVRTLCGSLGRL